jgi:hypothetical protein
MRAFFKKMRAFFKCVRFKKCLRFFKKTLRFFKRLRFFEPVISALLTRLRQNLIISKLVWNFEESLLPT